MADFFRALKIFLSDSPPAFFPMKILSFNKIAIGDLAENIFDCSSVSNLNLKGNKILLEELKHKKGFEKFVERRRQKKEQGFWHNLAINFDFCGLD